LVLKVDYVWSHESGAKNRLCSHRTRFRSLKPFQIFTEDVNDEGDVVYDVDGEDEEQEDEILEAEVKMTEDEEALAQYDLEKLEDDGKFQ